MIIRSHARRKRIDEAASNPYRCSMVRRPAPRRDGPTVDGQPTLLYLVGRMDRVVRRAIDDVVKAHGLSVNQYTTLSVLDHRSGLSNAQLARRSLAASPLGPKPSRTFISPRKGR